MQLTASQIIKKSLEMYAHHLKIFLTYVGLLAIPTILLTVIQVSLDGTFIIWGLMQRIGYAVMILPFALVSLWMTIALIRVTVEIYRGQTPTPISQELKGALGRLWPTFVVSLLLFLILMGGLVLFVIPAIVFVIWYFFSVYAVAVDGHKGKEALRYSKHLVHGKWWDVLWLLAGPLLAFGFALLLMQKVFIKIPIDLLLTVQIGSFTAFLVKVYAYNIGLSLLSLLFTPLTTCATTILYEELKNQQPS